MELQPQQVLWGAVSSLHRAVGHGWNALGGVWHLLTCPEPASTCSWHSEHPTACVAVPVRGASGAWVLSGWWDSEWVLQAEVQEETCTVTKLLLDVPGHTHTHMKEQSSSLSPCPKHVLRAHLIQRTIEGIFFLKYRFLYSGPEKSLLVTKGWAETPRWVRYTRPWESWGHADWRRLQGDLIMDFQNLKGDSKKGGNRLLARPVAIRLIVLN